MLFNVPPLPAPGKFYSQENEAQFRRLVQQLVETAARALSA